MKEIKRWIGNKLGRNRAGLDARRNTRVMEKMYCTYIYLFIDEYETRGGTSCV